ncbi:TRAP transporter large permease [Roseovarius sp.]|uniref:TRAP transporter large permease n=1 Tax=Roseovarius sp. TaxID=1486281 RepID=UPI003A97429B
MDIYYWLPFFMFAFLAVMMFTGYPVAFILGGTGLVFGCIGYALDMFSLIEFYNIVPRIWGGIAESLLLTAVPMFVFMGIMLEKSGVAEDLLHAFQVIFRPVPGALALSVTVMGTILAAATGIIGASVVMMTVMALPMLLANNYDKRLATGTIAAAGTLGILIPPSIMLVIMAELMAISAGTLFVAAMIPGLALALAYFLYILVLAWLRPEQAPQPPADPRYATPLAKLGLAIRALLPPVFLIFLVLGSILFGWASPTEASAVGAVGATLLALLRGRLSIKVLNDVVQGTALTGAMLFFIFAGATAFSYVFRSLGGDDVVSDFLSSSVLGSWGLLAALMLIIFVMGFFFDWVEISLIILPIVVPVIQATDFGGHVADQEKIYWFAILVAVNLQTSFLTPPFGFALFYLKGAAPPGVQMIDVYKGILPFVLIQLACLVLFILFPQIVMWLPGKLF